MNLPPTRTAWPAMPSEVDEGTVFRSLFLSYPDALLLVDGNGRIVLANPSAAALLGYTLDRVGVNSTLLLLAAIFTPVIALVLVPLVVRIRREEADESPQVVPAN